MKDGAAVDARFSEVNHRVDTVSKDVARIEGRVVSLEAAKESHSNGLTKHDSHLENLNRTLEKLELTFEQSLDAVNETLKGLNTFRSEFQGAIKVFKYVVTPSALFSAVIFIINQVVTMIAK